MKIVFDDEYEQLDSYMRVHDKNNYCLFVDQAGVNNEKAIIEMHWHEWLEITYIIEGTMNLQTPSGTFQVNAGECIVIGMQTLHRITGNIGNYRYQCLHINMGFILQHISPVLLNEKTFVIKDNVQFLECFSQIIHFMTKEDVPSQLKYKSSLLTLLSLCLEELPTELSKNMTVNHDDFSHILFYISTHYQENLSLKELSEHFHYSSQHISLMFKKYLNTTYYTYLIKLRLDRSRIILTTSQRRIIDIAIECGFNSEHSFINHFKKVYGMTPTQYRKKEIVEDY